MTRKLSALLAPLGALCLSLVLLPALLAQGAQFQLVADIPFGFHAGGKLLPAGQYRVYPLGHGSLVIGDVEPAGPQAAFTTTAAGGGAPRAHSQLVFQRYGNQYFLRQVWRAGMSLGFEAPPSRQEQAALFRAANSAGRVVVAARGAR